MDVECGNTEDRREEELVVLPLLLLLLLLVVVVLLLLVVLAEGGVVTSRVSVFPSEFDRWCSVRRKEVVTGKSKDRLFRFNSTVDDTKPSVSRCRTDMRFANTEDDYDGHI